MKDVDFFTPGARLALELECLLLDTRNDAVQSRWWDSAHEALEQWRQAVRTMEASIDAAPQQPAASSETVNVIGMPEFDGLLDHIYEHGTAAEGVIEKANAFARAVIARYAPQQPAAVDEAMVKRFLEAFQNTPGDEAIGADEKVVRRWLAALEAAQADAERWRYIRRKLCLAGNGNGTCAMQAFNLPAAIQGWPEPGKVAEFCDAAIDAAMRKEDSND